MKKANKTKALFDNERNFILYVLLGFLFVFAGFNLPTETAWTFPAILSIVAGVAVAGSGVFKYLERREMLLSSNIEIDEEHW